MGIIQIEIKNLAQIKSAFSKAPARMMVNLNRAIRQTIFFVESASQRNVPVKSGRLRGSIYRDFQPLKGELGYGAKYAGWVHDGTSPYTIRPSGKQALYWKGAAHPVKRVNHPGIRANPFLQRAVDDSELQIDKFFQGAVQDTLDEIAKETG